MPRYYFETDDDEFFYRDREGLTLEGPQAARLEALAALPDMVREHIPNGDHLVLRTAVRDEFGTVIFEGTLTLKGEWRLKD